MTAVEADEPLLEVSTDKVDTEIPSPVAGTLLEIRVQEDETVEVGAVLAVVGDQSAQPTEAAAGAGQGPGSGGRPSRDGDRDGAASRDLRADCGRGRGRPGADPGPGRRRSEPRRPRSTRSPNSTARAPTPKSATPVAVGRDAGYVTPLVRKLAKEHGVDLAAVTGTGVGGRIRKQDVLAAAEEAQEGRRGPRPAARAPAGRGIGSGRVGRTAGGGQFAARNHREDVPAAQDDRQADGRVAAGLGPADHGGGGRPDHRLPVARPGEGRLQPPARASSCPTCRSWSRRRSRR